MKPVVVILAVVAACCAEGIDHSKVVPVRQLVEPIEGAPVPKAARNTNCPSASPGQIPYQAGLILDGSSFCGGSLISNRWVLTAARCADGVTEFTVYLGTTQTDVAQPGRQVFTTSTKVVHEGYDPVNLNNDVGLVLLPEAVASTTYIKPITLASGSATYAGNTARVSGWGRTSGTSVSDQLMSADVTVVTNAVCQQIYGTSVVVSSTLCAQGSCVCIGDSGGPLVDPQTGHQIGVVGFSPSVACLVGYPIGFARITSFRSWITSNSGV